MLGRLHYGANHLSAELGHIPIQIDGLPCSCGKSGCLEAYANAEALVRYAEGGGFATARDVVAAANAGDARARRAVRVYARYLAAGCVAAVHLLNPSLIILAGGIAQDNPALVADLAEEINGRVLLPEARELRVLASQLGYFGGVLGAAAVAAERLDAAAVS